MKIFSKRNKWWRFTETLDFWCCYNHKKHLLKRVHPHSFCTTGSTVCGISNREYHQVLYFFPPAMMFVVFSKSPSSAHLLTDHSLVWHKLSAASAGSGALQPSPVQQRRGKSHESKRAPPAWGGDGLWVNGIWSQPLQVRRRGAADGVAPHDIPSLSSHAPDYSDVHAFCDAQRPQYIISIYIYMFYNF